MKRQKKKCYSFLLNDAHEKWKCITNINSRLSDIFLGHSLHASLSLETSSTPLRLCIASTYQISISWLHNSVGVKRLATRVRHKRLSFIDRIRKGVPGLWSNPYCVRARAPGYHYLCTTRPFRSTPTWYSFDLTADIYSFQTRLVIIASLEPGRFPFRAP